MGARATPWPRLMRKLDFQPFWLKNARSTLALSKPDIAPESIPKARAARMRYAPCRVLLRKAVSSARSGLPENQTFASAGGNKLWQMLVE